MFETGNFAWQLLKSPLRFKQITAPSTAQIPTDSIALYAKDKSGTAELFYKNEAGTERDLSLLAGAALTKVDDTNVTLTLGGSHATALVNAASLTLGWTGQLATGRGGTGVSALGDLTKVDDTNVTLTLGGTPTGALIKATSLTLGWTGTLAAARGGTGKSALADVTAGSSKISLGGTPTGAVVNAFSIDVNQANLDHGSIGGLSDDDHTGYALLAGRSGGQTLIGGTAASNKLTLQSTSNATRGDIDLDAADLTFTSGMRARMTGQNRFRYLNSMVVATRTTAQTISNSTHTFIQFNGTDAFDTDGLHNPSSNNTRLTAAIAGKYIVYVYMRWDAHDTGFRNIRVEKNSSGTPTAGNAIGFQNQMAITGGNETSQNMTFITELAANDHLECAVFQSSGGDLDASGDNAALRFGMAYIGE